MPRVAGLSATVLVLPIPCRPRALTVARLRTMWLIVLLVWVILSLAAIGGLQGGSRLPGDAAHQLDPTTRPELLGGVERAQRLDGRPGHVHRVGRAVDLGQSVANARRLEHRADRAAGDDAGTLAGGLEQHAAGAVDDLHLVGDRRPDHRDLDDVLLRVLDALADGLRHFAGLAQP